MQTTTQDTINNDILENLVKQSLSISDPPTSTITTSQTTNDQTTNPQLTNPQSSNFQSTTNPQSTNPQSETPQQVTNDESATSQPTTTKKAEVFEVSFSRKWDCGASEILENFLYLGAGKDASDVPYIQKTGITHVLCMVSGWKPRVAYSDISVNFKHLPISDTPLAKISELFPQAIEFIDSAREKNEKILVHCAAGISRSSTVVLAYLMKSHSMTLRQSFELVHSRRRIIRPNNGFFEQLMEWEKTIYGNYSMTRKDLPYVVPHLPPTPIAPSKKLEHDEGMAWAATVVTEEMLNKVFLDVCDGEYSAPKTSDFLEKVLLLTQKHPEVLAMQKKGYKWPKLSINLMKTAANWYKAKKN